jgi:hypothetical protein
MVDIRATVTVIANSIEQAIQIVNDALHTQREVITWTHEGGAMAALPWRAANNALRDGLQFIALDAEIDSVQGARWHEGQNQFVDFSTMHSNSRTGCHCLLCPDRLTDPLCTFRFIRALSGSLAKFTAIRRASSRVSRFGRRAMRRSDMSGIWGEAEVRGLRLKRR